MPKKLDKIKQEEFLKTFGDEDRYRKIRESCRIIKIGKSTFYRWMQDPAFNKKISKIKEKKDNDPYYLIKKGSVRAAISFLHKYGNSRGY